LELINREEKETPMRILFAFTLSLLLGGFASASCPRPASAPAIPNGATADEASMKQAHDAIQAYVNALEAFQACKKQEVEQAPSDISDETKLTWMAQGDAALDAANLLAAQFSYALKSFKERSGKTVN